MIKRKDADEPKEDAENMQNNAENMQNNTKVDAEKPKKKRGITSDRAKELAKKRWTDAKKSKEIPHKKLKTEEKSKTDNSKSVHIELPKKNYLLIAITAVSVLGASIFIFIWIKKRGNDNAGVAMQNLLEPSDGTGAYSLFSKMWGR